MYVLKKVNVFNPVALNRVNRILLNCGKDMFAKYGLEHWNNSWLKNFLIVCLCALKNRIYIVKDDAGSVVATFQLKTVGDNLKLQKLATNPASAGKGVGTYCMTEVERIAKEFKCKKVCLEVYDKSEHAIEFYKHRGYQVSGKVNTLKYTEILMEKAI